MKLTASKTLDNRNQGVTTVTNKTQHKLILKHLRTTKGLTVREAMIEYSISSLTKRIQELRDMGHDIVSDRKNHPVTGQRYVRYTLEEAEE